MLMIYECAPMEGVTGDLFRKVQSRHFAPADRYYTPFISPTANRNLTNRQLNEIRPENNEGIHVVPQLLGHNAEDMLWMINELKAMGYDEINYNLGCPSGTVVSKKKGSGLLSELEMLEKILDGLFEKSPLPISIKTRIGKESGEEFAAILELYNRYPVKELIIHSRCQTQQYRGLPDMKIWEYALKNSKAPLCYNGNVFHRPAAEKLTGDYPETERIMIGRGLAANPGLIGELRDGKPVTTEQLKVFHEELFEENLRRIVQDKPLLLHMKEAWFYLACSFEDTAKPLKRIRKAQYIAEYRAAAEDFFRECPLRESPGFYTE